MGHRAHLVSVETVYAGTLVRYRLYLDCGQSMLTSSTRRVRTGSIVQCRAPGCYGQQATQGDTADGKHETESRRAAREG